MERVETAVAIFLLGLMERQARTLYLALLLAQAAVKEFLEITLHPQEQEGMVALVAAVAEVQVEGLEILQAQVPHKAAMAVLEIIPHQTTALAAAVALLPLALLVHLLLGAMAGMARHHPFLAGL